MPPHPPHSIEAEQSLLGAILVNGEVLDRVENIVEANDFFEPIHQFLFEQLVRAKQERRHVSYSVLHAQLADEVKKTDVAGLTVSQYLARLMADAPTVIHAPDHARLVVEHAQRRKLIAMADAVRSAASCSSAAPATLATDFIEELDTVASRNRAQHVAPVSVASAVDRSISRMRAAMRNGGKMTGITTGVPALDEMLNGWQRGELIILAGRPGMGKSGAIISSIRQAAGTGISALLFSLEMSAEDITDRMLSDDLYRSRSCIPYFDIARGRLPADRADAIEKARNRLAELSVKIDPQGGLTVTQIATRVRRHQQWLERQGRTLDLVVVDHLHIVKASNRYAGNRVAEVTEISGGLKALAKDLNVPVVVLAQLSRQVENRDDKRPMLSDLRDSGSLEQDADLIMFLFREAYYLKDPATDAEANGDRLRRLPKLMQNLEVNVAKHRAGPTGVINLFFDVPSNALRSAAPYDHARSIA